MDFTIVTPSFRQLNWLELCIASVADQKDVRLEHIVQDAGTTGFDDFRKKMSKKWPDRNGYRRIMISEPDQGMYDAVNRGLKKGSAPLCAYLNCDEQYLPGALARILNLFQAQPSQEIFFGGVLIVGQEGRLISARKPVRLLLPHVTTCHLPNFTCAMFFRRQLLEARGAWFDSRWRDCADALWVMDRLKDNTKIGRCMEFTTAFTDTGSNMNLSPNAIREAGEIRESAPLIWRWFKLVWVLLHWAGKWLDGAYRKQAIHYSLYTFKSGHHREDFFKRNASPLWAERWFVRDRIHWEKMKRRLLPPSRAKHQIK